MESAVRAIPTVYKDVQFRSRLEARWAAFFDMCKWPWEYEPIDLAGYIPDFILRFHEPLLVEVKPSLDFKDLQKHVQKLEQSGWDKEMLIVGAMLMPPGDLTLSGEGSLGLLCERYESRVNWGAAVPYRCGKCSEMTICHDEWTYSCRRSGCYNGDHYLSDESVGLHSLWRKAGNAVQWKPPLHAVDDDFRMHCADKAQPAPSPSKLCVECRQNKTFGVYCSDCWARRK